VAAAGRGVDGGEVVARLSADAGRVLEVAARQNLAIRLHHERTRAGQTSARIEASIETAMGIKPGDSIAVRAIDGRETAADQHLAIRLQRNRTNSPVCSSARIETVVQAAVRIEPGHSAAVRAIHSQEIAADEHPAIRLQDDRSNRVRTCVRNDEFRNNESVVRSAIGV